MAELESAEEFARRVAMLWSETSGDRPAARLVESDRAAVVLAAKLELLDELIALDDASPDNLRVYKAVDMLMDKYAAAEPAVETREG